MAALSWVRQGWLCPRLVARQGWACQGQGWTCQGQGWACQGQLPPCRALATSEPCCYREDYTRLGLNTSATQEEIKAAYFCQAKLLHPDSSEQHEDTASEFKELNEAYRRLMYESKHGTSSFDPADPRNDPRTREYWEVRQRPPKSEEDRSRERLKEDKDRTKENLIIKRGVYGLLLGIFFGTVFPALFIGTEDYSSDPYSPGAGCQCDHCLLAKLQHSPGAARVVTFSSRAATTGCCTAGK